MEDLNAENVVSENQAELKTVSLPLGDWVSIRLALKEEIDETERSRSSWEKWEKDNPDDPVTASIAKNCNERIADLSRIADEIKKQAYPGARCNSEAGASGSAQTT